MKKINEIILFFNLISILFVKCQKKPIQIEVYPSEVEDDNTIMANEDFYRSNIRDIWSQMSPYNNMVYSRNPYMTPPYMPNYGQPGVINYNNYLPFISPKTYNVQNPLHFNYPKAPYVRGSQYSTYPKFRQADKVKLSPTKDTNLELTKVLEKEIAELHTLTEQAKKLADSKKKEAELKKLQLNRMPNKYVAAQQKSFLQVHENNQLYKFRRSNLDQLSLDPKEKLKFDENVKNIMEKLSKLEY